jgi:hypothetical protein
MENTAENRLVAQKLKQIHKKFVKSQNELEGSGLKEDFLKKAYTMFFNTFFHDSPVKDVANKFLGKGVAEYEKRPIGSGVSGGKKRGRPKKQITGGCECKDTKTGDNDKTGKGVSGGKKVKKLSPWIELVNKVRKEQNLKGVKQAIEYIKKHDLYKK